MNESFAMGFLKEASTLRFPQVHGRKRKLDQPSPSVSPAAQSHFSWKPVALFTAGGALEGVSESVATGLRPRRAGALIGLTAAMGALEGTHLGADAPTWQKVLHTGTGAALGGGLGYALAQEVSGKRRLLAAGLGAAATGLMSSL